MTGLTSQSRRNLQPMGHRLVDDSRPTEQSTKHAHHRDVRTVELATTLIEQRPFALDEASAQPAARSGHGLLGWWPVHMGQRHAAALGLATAARCSTSAAPLVRALSALRDIAVPSSCRLHPVHALCRESFVILLQACSARSEFARAARRLWTSSVLGVCQPLVATRRRHRDPAASPLPRALSR